MIKAAFGSFYFFVENQDHFCYNGEKQKRSVLYGIEKTG